MRTQLDSSAIGSATLAEQLDAAVYRRRNWIAGLPVVLAWLAAPPASSLALAGALVALGALLRAWGTLHNRYAQGEAKTLTESGPYSWLRNPLYLANSLVILGGVAGAGAGAFLPAVALWCALVYGLTVRHEERRLRAKYGAPYLVYCDRVARWLPRRQGEWPRERWARFGAALLAQTPVLLILAPRLLRALLR